MVEAWRCLAFSVESRAMIHITRAHCAVCDELYVLRPLESRMMAVDLVCPDCSLHYCTQCGEQVTLETTVCPECGAFWRPGGWEPKREGAI